MSQPSRFPRHTTLALLVLGLFSFLLAACATTGGPSMSESPLMRECDAQVRAELHLRNTPVQAPTDHSQAIRTARTIGGGALLALEIVAGPVLPLLSPVAAGIGLVANLATIGGAAAAEAAATPPMDTGPPTREAPPVFTGTVDGVPVDTTTTFAEADTALRMRYYDLVDACVRARETTKAAAAESSPNPSPQ